jgi:hypothetical protein
MFSLLGGRVAMNVSLAFANPNFNSGDLQMIIKKQFIMVRLTVFQSYSNKFCLMFPRLLAFRLIKGEFDKGTASLIYFIPHLKNIPTFSAKGFYFPD